MKQSWMVRSIVLTPLMVIGLMSGELKRSIAQSLPTCDPPRPDEYLLLVRDPNAETQNQLRQLLPSNAVLTDCRYDNNPVVRVEGFVSEEIANAWAQYLGSSAGLQAIVARPPAAAATNFPSPTQVTPSQVTAPTPPASPTPPTPASPPATPPAAATPPAPAPQPAQTAAQPTPAFSPQPLGAGYAVVVNYSNRPEVALDVQQVTNQAVGLVAFEQRPYLLAAYTPDPASASAVLKSLTDRGFVASIVDSRRAILLTPSVAR